MHFEWQLFMWDDHDQPNKIFKRQGTKARKVPIGKIVKPNMESQKEKISPKARGQKCGHQWGSLGDGVQGLSSQRGFTHMIVQFPAGTWASSSSGVTQPLPCSFPWPSFMAIEICPESCPQARARHSLYAQLIWTGSLAHLLGARVCG